MDGIVEAFAPVQAPIFGPFLVGLGLVDEKLFTVRSDHNFLPENNMSNILLAIISNLLFVKIKVDEQATSGNIVLVALGQRCPF